MHFQKSFHSFQLHDYNIFHQHIYSMFSHLHTVIKHFHNLLPLYMQTSFGKFMAQCFLINCFNKTRG